MALIRYLEKGDSLSVAAWNELFEEADRKLSLAMDGKSLLFYSTAAVSTQFGSSRFFEPFIGKRRFFFCDGTGFFQKRIFQELTSNDFYNHSIFTAAAAAVQPNTALTPYIDHTAKIVRTLMPPLSDYQSINQDFDHLGNRNVRTTSLFEYSLEPHTSLQRASESDPLEPYAILSEGGFWEGRDLSTAPVLERVHNYTQAELIYCGENQSTVNFPAAYKKYNHFRIHNLNRQAMTFNFIGATGTAFSLVIPAMGSRCVRRTAVDGVYTLGFSHFQKMLSGDPRLFNGFWGAVPQHEGWMKNNVTNPVLLMDLVWEMSKTKGGAPKFILDTSRFWDASGIYCNKDYSASSSWELSPPIAGKGFFGDMADSTPVGNILFHCGDFMKVATTGTGGTATETHQRVTFRGMETLEEDCAAAGITVAPVNSEVNQSGIVTYVGPGLKLTATGTVDAVGLSTNIIHAKAAGSPGPLTPVKSFPVYIDRPYFYAQKLVPSTLTTQIPQRNADGSTTLTPFNQTVWGNPTELNIPQLTDTIGTIRDWVESKTTAYSEFSSQWKFTGFGPMLNWTRASDILAHGRLLRASTHGFRFTGGRVIQRFYTDFDAVGWPTWRRDLITYQDANNVVQQRTPPYAFHSPRVEQWHSDMDIRITHNNGTNVSVFYPTPGFPAQYENWLYPDWDYAQVKKTSDTTPKNRVSKVRKKTGVSCLFPFYSQNNQWYYLGPWARGQKTQYSDPIFPYVPTVHTDSNRWYPQNRNSLLAGTPSLWFGRWRQFDRLPLLVDYFNNIASLINSVSRIYQLNFEGFFAARAGTASGVIGSTSYSGGTVFRNIRPRNQYWRISDTRSTLLYSLLGVPVKTIDDLPASFFTLRDSKVVNRQKIQDPNNGENYIWTETTTTTPLYNAPLPGAASGVDYNWVTIDDVKQVAEGLGFKFQFFQAVVPLNLEFENAGFQMLFGRSEPDQVTAYQKNYYAFIETSNGESVWVSDVTAYRLNSGLQAADIFGRVISGSMHPHELILPERFRRRWYGVTQPEYEPNRGHGAISVISHGVTASGTLTPSAWLDFGTTNFSAISEENFGRRYGSHGLAAIPFTLVAPSGDSEFINPSTITGRGEVGVFIEDTVAP